MTTPCPRCGKPVSQVDEHVATVDEVAEWLEARHYDGVGHSYFRCAPEVTDDEVLHRLVEDGLGGRQEPGKDEL